MDSNFNANYYLSLMLLNNDNKLIRRQKLLFCLLTYFTLSSSLSNAQELEPRALTNIPVGMNFALAGYAYAQGNLLFDPALPLEDTEAKLHSIIGAYVRSINFFGLSGTSARNNFLAF